MTLCSLVSPPATAWGAQGHRVAGSVAEQHLSPAAQKAVFDILGNESLASASTWADEMRSSPSQFWQQTAGPLHYVNPPASGSYKPENAPAHGDAYTALADFADDITNETLTLEKRQLALRFSIHIVQDLHQPLHAGVRKDRGGNDVRVSFAGRASNLHRVWDSGLLQAAGRNDSAWVTHLWQAYPLADRSLWEQTDPLVWIEESASISRRLYPDSTQLGQRYIDLHRETVERRLAMAGVRTAAYLNALFDQSLGAPAEAAPTDSLWNRLQNFLEEVVERAMRALIG